MTSHLFWRISGLMAAFFLALAAGGHYANTSGNSAELGERIPVIYCTDLFHPHDDPDDHFDLATIYAIPELDLKAIILDQGARQLERPGSIPVSQMNRITGRSVRFAIGLSEKLQGPADKALEQETRFQEGVELILKTLRESPSPVAIITVGSVRDVAAAFNRQPDLFRAKAARVMMFIGEASTDFMEYNVTVDPAAYVCLMRSGLPVYWVPCFDGGGGKNNGHASFWVAKHEDLLKDCAPEVLQFFIYALEKETAPALEFLTLTPDPEARARLLGGRRNLWCTAVFTSVSGRKMVLVGDRYLAVPQDNQTALKEHKLFGFSPVYVSISEEAKISYGNKQGAQKVMRFEVLDRENYARGMTSATAQLLSSLRAAP
ncbi:MAG TPA: nucleoside hydrolase [archaeon]|nr:nucleoside hydrolase [archaeon]